MAPRVREALVSYRDGMLQAMATKRYSAIVLDEQLDGAFQLMFRFGLVGPDGVPDTDMWRRKP